MDYIAQLTNYYRVLHQNIRAFRFVIYSPDWRINVKEYFWIKVNELPLAPEWLGQKGIELARENGLYPHALTLGLVNQVAVVNKGGRIEKRYIPMIDFPSNPIAIQGVPEHIVVSLELLDVGPGVIVQSSRNFSDLLGVDFSSFHFFGFSLWDKARWAKFVADGVFDEYGLSRNKKLPMYPKWPFFAAKTIGEPWARLVTKQRGMAFLRIAEKYSQGSQPKVMELFLGDTKLSIMPPDYAPCMPPFREAEEKWWNSISEREKPLLEGYPVGTEFISGPELKDFCTPDCPINGCSLKCPATQVRLVLKAQRVKGHHEPKQLKQLSE